MASAAGTLALVVSCHGVAVRCRPRVCVLRLLGTRSSSWDRNLTEGEELAFTISRGGEGGE